MKRVNINRLIGYGVLTFAVGYIVGYAWVKPLQYLILVGTLMTYSGIISFFKETDLNQEFKAEKGEDAMTYFWNRIVLKVWTFIFMVWMLFASTILLFAGIQ